MAYARKSCSNCGKIATANHMVKKEVKRSVKSTNSLGLREVIGTVLGSKESSKRFKTVIFNSGKRSHTGYKQVWLCYPCAGYECPQEKAQRLQAEEFRAQRLEEQNRLAKRQKLRKELCESVWQDCLKAEAAIWEEPKGYSLLIANIQSLKQDIENKEGLGKKNLLESINSRLDYIKALTKEVWRTTIDLDAATSIKYCRSANLADPVVSSYRPLGRGLQILNLTISAGFIVFLLSMMINLRKSTDVAVFIVFPMLGTLYWLYFSHKKYFKLRAFTGVLNDLADKLNEQFEELYEVFSEYEISVLSNIVHRFSTSDALKKQSSNTPEDITYFELVSAKLSDEIEPDYIQPSEFKSEYFAQQQTALLKDITTSLIKHDEAIEIAKYIFMKEVLGADNELTAEDVNLIKGQLDLSDEARQIAESFCSHDNYFELLVKIMHRNFELDGNNTNKNNLIKTLVTLASTDHELCDGEKEMLYKISSGIGVTKAYCTRLINKEIELIKEIIKANDDLFIDDLFK